MRDLNAGDAGEGGRRCAAWSDVGEPCRSIPAPRGLLLFSIPRL